MVPVELAAMFRFMVVGIAEMLLWLLYLIVSKSVCDFMYLIIWYVGWGLFIMFVYLMLFGGV